MLSVSIMTCLVLLAEVANLVATTVLVDRSAVSTIIADVVIEAAAAILIIFLFNPGSEFVKSAISDLVLDFDVYASLAAGEFIRTTASTAGTGAAGTGATSRKSAAASRASRGTQSVNSV